MNNCLDTTTAFNIDENETSGTCTNNRCNFVSNYINHKNNNIVVNGDNITINHTGTTSETEVTFAGTNYRIKNVKLFNRFYLKMPTNWTKKDQSFDINDYKTPKEFLFNEYHILFNSYL